MLVGEAALAHEYALVNFGVDLAVLQLVPAELAADEAARAAAYLQLPLPPETVHFVDSAEGLARAASLLLEPAASGEAAILGLDCEWEARTEKSRDTTEQLSVSLLQVGLPHRRRPRPCSDILCSVHARLNLCDLSCFFDLASVTMHLEMPQVNAYPHC